MRASLVRWPWMAIPDTHPPGATTMKYKGGCHCGQIAFDVEAQIGPVIECNCSMCSKRGYPLAFVPAAQVVLHTPDADMLIYMFNTHRIRHYVCPVCGVGPFGRSTDPSGIDMFALNVRCLDGVDPQALEIQPLDGRSR